MWEKIPSLQGLKLFDSVVRHRSMTRAACEAGVSQSAVSQAIRQLEDFVQAELLDRSTRPMQLTDEGLEFHRAIIEGFGRLAGAVEDLRKAGNRDADAVTVSCNLGFATYWLMPRLNYFSVQHPETPVHVMAAYQGAPDLHDGSDIAIRFGDGAWPDSRWELLLEETLLPVCSPSYLEKHGTIDDVSALSTRRLIHVAVKDPDWLGWEDYFHALGLRRAKTSSDLRFGNYVQAVQSALIGDGLMLGWRSVVGELVTSGQLKAAVNHPVHLQSGYYFNSLQPQDTGTGKEQLLDWLKQQANDTPEF